MINMIIGYKIMKQKVYFKINTKELIIEEVLVDFNGFPLFFVCKDQEGQYYTALCYDIDDERYIVTKTTIDKLFNLLTNKMTMRNIFLSETRFWDIIIAENIENDLCIEKNIKEVDVTILPYEGEYFEIITETHKQFLNRIKNLKTSAAPYIKRAIIPLENCNTINNELLQDFGNIVNRNQPIPVQKVKSSIRIKLSDFKQKHFDEEMCNIFNTKNMAFKETSTMFSSADTNFFIAA